MKQGKGAYANVKKAWKQENSKYKQEVTAAPSAGLEPFVPSPNPVLSANAPRSAVCYAPPMLSTGERSETKVAHWNWRAYELRNRERSRRRGDRVPSKRPDGPMTNTPFAMHPSQAQTISFSFSFAKQFSRTIVQNQIVKLLCFPLPCLPICFVRPIDP